MKEVATSMPFPKEGDSSAVAMDLQLLVLLRVENLAAQLGKQLRNVDIAAMKRGYSAAAERPTDV